MESELDEEQSHPRKIFVGGLAHKTSTQHLRDYFARYGSIVDAVVLRWPDGRSRGFGYVTYSDVASAVAAMLETHQVGGRKVDVKRAVPGTNKLFVGGLPQNATAAELRDYFETFGTVSDAVVMLDPVTTRSRGFGFVCFLPGQEGAAAVTTSLEQYKAHRLRGKWIEVKNACPPHKLLKDGEGSDALHDSPASSTRKDETPSSASGKQKSPKSDIGKVPSPNRRSTLNLEPKKVALASSPPPVPPGYMLGGVGRYEDRISLDAALSFGPWLPPLGRCQFPVAHPGFLDVSPPGSSLAAPYETLWSGPRARSDSLFESDFSGLQRSLAEFIQLQAEAQPHETRVITAI